MNFLENIRGALGAIFSNKLRSSLTMLGIIIGVASVVLMVAIGQGAQRSVTARIQSLGTNLLIITPGSPNQTNVRFGGGGGGGTASSTLKSTDVEAIKRDIRGLSGISPVLQTRLQAIAGNQNASAIVVGVVPEYLSVQNADVAYGSFITDQDIQQMNTVAILGSQILATLLPDDPNPLGRDIRVGNRIFTIGGIMKPKGQTAGANQDNQIFVPLSTMQFRLMGQDSVSTINVSVADQEDMQQLQAEITAVLLNEHRISDVSKQDFTVLNQADAVETLNDVTAIFTLLLGGIAAISLIVGGIGVMNIMLVSVTERTREIGIRKAIGAKKRDILLQFLVESTVLSLLGGTIGILISLAASWIVRAYVSLDVSITLSPVVLAFLFSIGVGIFFGMLPAWKAASLKPIQALRYE